MNEVDAEQLLHAVADARKWLNGDSRYAYYDQQNDSCVMGQWNTFQYVAKNEETLKWAEVKQLTPAVQQLRQSADDLKHLIDSSNQFLDAIEKLAQDLLNHQGGSLE